MLAVNYFCLIRVLVLISCSVRGEGEHFERQGAGADVEKMSISDIEAGLRILRSVKKDMLSTDLTKTVGSEAGVIKQGNEDFDNNEPDSSYRQKRSADEENGGEQKQSGYQDQKNSRKMESELGIVVKQDSDDSKTEPDKSKRRRRSASENDYPESQIMDFFREAKAKEGTAPLLSAEAVYGELIPDGALEFFLSDHRAREKRDVDQTQRDIVLKTVNDLRRSVNSSNINYLRWNSVEERMVNIWTAQCKYNAPVYVTAPGIILKLISANLTNFEVELQNSFQFYDVQTALTSIYVTKVSANVNFCPLLVTDSAGNMTNLYLAAVSLSYVKGFARNQTQYSVGPACTTCLSGVYWCDDGLCRDDCSPQIPSCYCRPDCLNCAGYNETTCQCSCLEGWGGVRCEYNITESPTVPNCTTLAPSTVPTTYLPETTTITVPITSMYYDSSINATLQPLTTETKETTMASTHNESFTTEETMNETNADDFNDTMTTPDATANGSSYTFNQTTSPFSNENLTTDGATTTTDDVIVMTTTIDDVIVMTTTIDDVIVMTTTTDDDVIVVVNVTELVTDTTLTTSSPSQNTSTLTSTIKPTVYTNPYFDPFNYTQHLIDIESLLLRLLLMFQYYVIPIAPTTSSSISAINSASGSTPVGTTLSTTTTEDDVIVVVINATEYVTASTTGRLSSSYVNATSSPIFKIATDGIITTADSTMQENTGPRNQSDLPIFTADEIDNHPTPATTTQPPANTISNDLLNYLNYLEEIKNLIWQILLTLELSVTASMPTTTTTNTTNALNATLLSTGQVNNLGNETSETTTTPFQSNRSDISATATAITNSSFNTSMPVSLLASNTTLTPTAPENTYPNANASFTTTARPQNTSDPFDPVWQSLLEILRRLEIFLQTMTTASNQNIASTTNPVNPSATTPGIPTSSNWTSGSNISNNSAAVANATGDSPPSTANPQQVPNITATPPTLNSSGPMVTPNALGNTSSSYNGGYNTTVIMTSSNSSNSTFNTTGASSNSTTVSHSGSSSGNNTSGGTSSTVAANPSAPNQNYYQTAKELEEVVINILSLLESLLRGATRKPQSPTSTPNGANSPTVDPHATTPPPGPSNNSTADSTRSPPAGGNQTPSHLDPTPDLTKNSFWEMLIKVIGDRGIIASTASQSCIDVPKILLMCLLIGTILKSRF